ISISGGSVNLTPPTTGAYAGIGLFQDRSLAKAIQLSSTATLQLPGVVYAPAAAVQLSGSSQAGSAQGGGDIVATPSVSGSASVNVDPEGNTVRLPDVRLVE